MKKNRLANFVVYFTLFLATLYGGGRVYFWTTAGFTIGNISSDYTYDSSWDTRSLDLEEQERVNAILGQHFTYLGKGCQSYVFLSEDGEYVIKFFKYQRFRPNTWVDLFTFIPAVDSLQKGKIEKKTKKREAVWESWRIAFDHLEKETGLVYVHLNKSDDLPTSLKITDKIGFNHDLDPNAFEFLVQKRANMLCDTLDQMMVKGEVSESHQLLKNLLAMVVSEYHRGLADNDHALIQNTGVLDGAPVHVDVGQFVINEKMKNPAVYSQELFNKTYKFRIWLAKAHPELTEKFDRALHEQLGDQMYSLRHQPK